MHNWLGWSAGILGSVAASLLTFWLFLPVAAAIGMIYFDRIAVTVERRYYPWLPPPNGASVSEQLLDGLVVVFMLLGLNIVALVLTVMVPGIGLIAGWMITAYGISRGLFVSIAMRRMPRSAAEALYRSNRGIILLQGTVLALAAYLPVMNLLLPMIGVATMVHVLDMALVAEKRRGRGQCDIV